MRRRNGLIVFFTYKVTEKMTFELIFVLFFIMIFQVLQQKQLFSATTIV